MLRTLLVILAVVAPMAQVHAAATQPTTQKTVGIAINVDDKNPMSGETLHLTVAVWNDSEHRIQVFNKPVLEVRTVNKDGTVVQHHPKKKADGPTTRPSEPLTKTMASMTVVLQVTMQVDPPEHGYIGTVFNGALQDIEINPNERYELRSALSPGWLIGTACEVRAVLREKGELVAESEPMKVKLKATEQGK
jgi:hypothetical protein